MVTRTKLPAMDTIRDNEADEHAAAQIAQLLQHKVQGNEDDEDDQTDAQTDRVENARENVEKIHLVPRSFGLADQRVVEDDVRVVAFIHVAVTEVRAAAQQLDAVDAVLAQWVLVVFLVDDVAQHSVRSQL